MTLLNAPDYDPRADLRKRNILIASGVTVLLLSILTLAGYMSGHGWLFTNLGAEHQVNKFFEAIEAKDYSKAYGIYYNDANWQQHPQKYSGYTLQRFTEDWTTQSPIHEPILWHHVDVSRTDGSGTFGTNFIVAVNLNHGHEIFMDVNRADGLMTWPAPHELKMN